MLDRRELDAAADYTVQVTDGYLSQLAGLGLAPAGLALLELGPGADLGPALILSGLGARVHVADRFLVRWSPGLVARYEHLRQRLVAQRPDLPTAGLDAVLEAGRHGAAVVAHHVGIERLSLPAGSLDVVLSNAVLEHVHHLGRACRQLARLTAPGGLGCHQIDFRDHRDFGRPLEHLTESAARRTWRHLRHRGAQGSAHRAADYAAAFSAAGFTVEAFEPNLHAGREQLEAVRPRLRGEFAELSDAELAVLSGRLVVRRLAQQAGAGEAEAGQAAAGG